MSEKPEKQVKHLEDKVDDTRIRREDLKIEMTELRSWLALRIGDQKVEFQKSMLSQTRWLGACIVLVMVLLALIAFK